MRESIQESWRKTYACYRERKLSRNEAITRIAHTLSHKGHAYANQAAARSLLALIARGR